MQQPHAHTPVTNRPTGPIGIFDSGYGGLTILNKIRQRLPGYDYIYLGDNARAPYGTRSFEIIYRFTLEAVRCLFDQGCPLVILACNTASAKALRSIQQNDLPDIDPTRRVLGIIRPTVEALAQITRTGHIALLATPGTVNSGSYEIEIKKQNQAFVTESHSCPMWVPLVENNEATGPGADFFVKKDVDAVMASDPEIDTLILGCTHYPLLIDKIRQYIPPGVELLTQGEIVADSLADYLRRHPEMERRLSQSGARPRFLTTENAEKFSHMASIFLNQPVEAETILL